MAFCNRCVTSVFIHTVITGDLTEDGTAQQFETLAEILFSAGGTVPWGQLIRSSVVSYSVCIITPVGRPVGEAVRAAMIESFAGPERAALAATSNQTPTLVGNAVLAALAAILVIISKETSFLTAAFVIYAFIACGLALAIQVIARWRGFISWLISLAPHYRKNIVSFYRSSKQTAFLPVGPGLIMIAGRGLQGLQFGLLCYVLGFDFSLDTVFIGQGIYLIEGAIEDWIPAQIGTIDGAFTIAASSIDIPQAIGLSIAVMVDCVQLFWVTVGALLPVIGDTRREIADNLILICALEKIATGSLPGFCSRVTETTAFRNQSMLLFYTRDYSQGA